MGQALGGEQSAQSSTVKGALERWPGTEANAHASCKPYHNCAQTWWLQETIQEETVIYVKPRFNILKCWCGLLVLTSLSIICFHSKFTFWEPKSRSSGYSPPMLQPFHLCCCLSLSFYSLRLSEVRQCVTPRPPFSQVGLRHRPPRGGGGGAGSHTLAATSGAWWVKGTSADVRTSVPCPLRRQRSRSPDTARRCCQVAIRSVPLC